MSEEAGSKADGFLSASELLTIKGVGNVAWEDWQQSEVALPKIGQKHFEPTGHWLEEMQLENGLKNRKRLLAVEKVDRASQLASAEWLPGSQKARVTKKSGQKWDSFGYEEKMQLYLLPEEALILLEMNCLELNWNGMPLSIQQAYEVIINSDNSKCTLDEYRVYSQLVRRGYRLQRTRDKSSLDSKSSNTAKRIIMNPDGLWTPNTSPTMDKQTSDSNGSTVTSKNSSEYEDDMNIVKTDKSDNDKSPKAQRIAIVSEETVLGSVRIIKNTSPAKDAAANQVGKWPGSRIQRNVKLMPRRNDKVNNSNSRNADQPDQAAPQSIGPEKRRNSDPAELPSAKKPRPEIIELSDDEIEEIPRPMTRMEILNTLPNLAGSTSECLFAELPRAYLPPGVKPAKDFYRHDRQRLLNLAQTDNVLRSNLPLPNNHNNVHQSNGGQQQASGSHFYSQGTTSTSSSSQCQDITSYGPNNGYTYRGMRCQRDVGGGGSYIQQNVSHNTIHSPYSGTVVQSNYVNYVMEVMGNIVRSFRQQQFQQTTFCQTLFAPRYPYHHQQQQSYQQQHQPYQQMNYYARPQRENYNNYNRRGGGGGGGAHPPVMPTSNRGRGGYQQRQNNHHNDNSFEPCQPSFTKRPGVSSWSDLKRRWRDETTITIEDEEPAVLEPPTTATARTTGAAAAAAATGTDSSSEVQVVQESVSPLISSPGGITSMAGVYERLRVIRSATDRTIRARRVDYALSYEVFSATTRNFRKASPGNPMCRIFVVNSKKESFMDASKLQRLQQESKEVPVVVAFVSQSCISYIQPGAVLLPNLS